MVTLAANDPGRPCTRPLARVQNASMSSASIAVSAATGTNHSRATQARSRSMSSPVRNTHGSVPSAGADRPAIVSQAFAAPGYQAGRAGRLASRRPTSVRNSSRCGQARQVTTSLVAMQLKEVLLAIDAATMSAWQASWAGV